MVCFRLIDGDSPGINRVNIFAGTNIFLAQDVKRCPPTIALNVGREIRQSGHNLGQSFLGPGFAVGDWIPLVGHGIEPVGFAGYFIALRIKTSIAKVLALVSAASTGDLTVRAASYAGDPAAIEATIVPWPRPSPGEFLDAGEATANMLLFLPLAHVFERAWIECAGLVMGRGHLYFAETLDTFLQDPERFLKTSSMLIADAIKHFGYKIVIRSGEPLANELAHRAAVARC